MGDIRTLDYQRQQARPPTLMKPGRAILLFLVSHYVMMVACFAVWAVWHYHDYDASAIVFVSVIIGAIVGLVVELFLLCIMHIVLGIQSAGRRGLIVAVRSPWRFMAAGAGAALVGWLGLFGIGYCSVTRWVGTTVLLAIPALHIAAGFVLFWWDVQRIAAPSSVPSRPK